MNKEKAKRLRIYSFGVAIVFLINAFISVEKQSYKDEGIAALFDNSLSILSLITFVVMLIIGIVLSVIIKK